jgi:uncharacterized protein YndB with AHSA1/START domain
MSESLVIEAVRKTVTVDCTVEEAFRVFTADANSWWPVATHSINGRDVEDVVFEGREGGEVYELTANGEKGHWARVVEWDPPSRLVLAWNILEREAVATDVEVRFVAEGDRTRVELEHRGWEAIAEGAEAKRGSYDNGWDQVLGVYEAAIGG